MRLVHYLIMQGLGVTRDWNSGAHENASFVSCVHLRNMSHVSLSCLSLLLHTCVDKALVPVNRCAACALPASPKPAFYAAALRSDAAPAQRSHCPPHAFACARLQESRND
jgi:hypothetical protein